MGPVVKRVTLWGRNLRVAREGVGLTQADLAFAIGGAQSSIAAWEAGVRPPPDDMKIRIARILHQDPHEMFPLVEDNE
jgi:transcriptional regulator with XRE-family HTH domain